MPNPQPRPPKVPDHGHTGPTTPAEDAARRSPMPDEDKRKIAEEASRAEDA